MKRYLWNVWIAVDQLVNTLLFGYPDETISSRLGKAQRAGRLRWYNAWLAHFLNWLDPNHCIDAIEDDEGWPAPYRRKAG